MSYPEQIQKQVDAANEVIKSFEEQVAKSESKEVEDSQQADNNAANENVVTKPQVEVPPAEDGNSFTYKQRWHTLQGQFNHAQSRANSAEQRIEQLEQLITSMQATPAPTQDRQLITEADRETFGDDMLDVIARATAQASASKDKEINDLRQAIARLQGLVPAVHRVEQAAAQTASERFYSTLASNIPDWQQVNASSNFHGWLLDIDPLTGISRQTYLADAQNSGDVGRVISIFKAWKQTSDTAVQSTQRAVRTAVKDELEMQVAPGRSSAINSTPASPQAKTWTRAGITKFYKDAREGVFKGREDERAALERDIFVAQREGRVDLQAA